MKKKIPHNILSMAILVFISIIIVVVSKKISNERYYRIMETSIEQYSVGAVAYDVDLEASDKHNKSIISGYIFQYMWPKSDLPIKMYLHDVDTGKNIWVKLQQQDRSDVEAYYSDGTDYSVSGFSGAINNKILNNKTYQIYICFKWDHYYCALNKYIVDGQLVDTISLLESDGSSRWIKTDEVERPVFSNENLMNIVMSARLCSYLSHTGSYVYQLQDKLYFITGENINYDENGNCTVYWTYWTNQTQKIPSENIDGKFGHIDGTICINDDEDDKLVSDGYRVMVFDLPDCSISKMSMSCFTSENEIENDSFSIDMY